MGSHSSFNHNEISECGLIKMNIWICNDLVNSSLNWISNIVKKFVEGDYNFIYNQRDQYRRKKDKKLPIQKHISNYFTFLLTKIQLCVFVSTRYLDFSENSDFDEGVYYSSTNGAMVNAMTLLHTWGISLKDSIIALARVLCLMN